MDQKSIDPNPPHGEKGHFRKLTVTIPQEIYERLIRESARRKIAGRPNQLLSALLREALSEYLDRREPDKDGPPNGTESATGQ
ncbi:MAG: hypothetical protein ACR2I2_13905 [Bryobacteraceae bacterium]